MTLTFRLIATSFAWVLLTLIVTAALLVLLFHGHIEKRFDAALNDHMEELVAASDYSATGELDMTWRPSDPRFNRPHSGWYWEIRNSRGSLARSGSLWRDSLGVEWPAGDGSRRIMEFTGPEGERLHGLIASVTFPRATEPLLFVVAGPADDIDEDIHLFTIQVTVTLAVLGLGLLLAVWFQVRFGLRPLVELQRALSDIRHGRAERMPEDFPQEVRPVVDELNALLDHKAALLQRARTQAANLAHALKNPLTVIRNEAAGIEGESAAVIRRQVDAMNANMDRYLSRTRVAGTAGVLGVHTPVRQVVEDLCFYMQRLYREREIHIDRKVSGHCSFRGEEQDLEEMLGNLIDNACKWANSRVRITVECESDKLVIRVEDDGEGIPEALRGHAIERGRRLDEQVPGTGLGLDIVRDIAELYRGSLRLERSGLGGLGVSLELPAA